MYRKTYEVVGYTYDADFHCPDCTRDAMRSGRLQTGLVIGERDYKPSADENGIPEDLIDSEGNEIHPVFLGDCQGDEICGDCLESIG